MPVRRWFSALLALLFLAPVITLLIIGFILFAPTSGPVFPSVAAQERIRDESDQWSDPSWQSETSDWLLDESMDVTLLTNGEVSWQSSPLPERVSGRVIHVEEISQTQSFVLYAPNDAGPPQQLANWMVPVALMASLALAVLIIAWFLRRSIIEPLTATSAAAQQLAAGTYDADIPHSRVREVNQLAESFTSMRDHLHDSLTRQAAIEEERRFLISAVAHDLRTPLFALRGSLEGIATGVANTEEKRQQYLQIALRRANDLENLIRDLFAWSRLELTSLELNPSSIGLRSLIQRAVESIRPQAETRNIHIEDVVANAQVTLDADLMQRAIGNVLDNALNYSSAGESIEIDAEIQSTDLIITIRDHGSGIPESELEKVFNPMFRGEDSRNRNSGGAGLGLNVARRILEAHGGAISARNHPDGGAEFELRVPTTPE